MIRNKVAVWTLVVTLGMGMFPGTRGLQAQTGVYDEEPTGGEMFVDAVVVRPMTLIASAVGLAAWVVTLPFSIPAGSMEKSAEEWVGGPLKYTFLRPLGNLDPEAEPVYRTDAGR